MINVNISSQDTANHATYEQENEQNFEESRFASESKKKILKKFANARPNLLLLLAQQISSNLTEEGTFKKK